MLITKEIEINLSGRIQKWYEDKGYILPKIWDKKHKSFVVPKGSKIIVKVEDLTQGSHVIVQVKCDYCGKVMNRDYKDYIEKHDDMLGDCCHKCEGVKYKKTIKEKYGVNHVFELPEIREKTILTNNQKYGCDWQQQNKDVQNKSKETMRIKYGYDHALQVPEFSAKMMLTRIQNNKLPTSKPQRKLGELLLQLYGNCELEYPCDKCSLDCMVVINNIPIDVEYDGWYYHQDRNRDIKRDNFVKKQGYKILRIKSNKKDDMPTLAILDEKIQALLNGYNYMEIQM